ncbi:hypothetical protein RCO28_00240 [Streptomyces sp. LHD-70]|uniref:hypothetical protein n=1 Tax=Streptomyces sp. LHD-70 TaxID=3072140 RepID=UPI002810719C|nr:hypothetical protein [Streptomyces sp. LHD-70]MDQ8700922.1 hypothetical protein [Streptomyces sp. LHD-70]
MAGELKVSPSELRASAHAQDGIADRVSGPSDKAIKDTGTAAEAMDGWSVSIGLKGIAESWEAALRGVHSRLAVGSRNLSETAKTHQWNEKAVAKDFEGFDGSYVDGEIMSAPASSTPGVSAISAPVDSGNAAGRGRWAPGLDDFQDSRPVMPTYTPPVENVTRDPRASYSVDDMRNAKPAPGSTYDPDEIRGAPAPYEGPRIDRPTDFG